MREWLSIVQDLVNETFAEPTMLYHGTQVEHLWLIIKSDEIACNHYSDDLFSGVSLSRSFDVARRHGESDEESMHDTFYDYFGIKAPPRIEFGGSVMAFDRSKIVQKIEPVDYFGDGSEEEERVHGDFPLQPSLAAIYVNRRGLEFFFSEIERGRRECHERQRDEYNRCYGPDYAKIVHFLRTSPLVRDMP